MISKPRGTVDLIDEKIAKRSYILKVIEEITNNFSFSKIETPLFEAEELFLRAVDKDNPIVSKEIYSFSDKKDRKLALRPELTAPVIRAIAENKIINKTNSSTKNYYIGPVFRYERPQLGRQRQFTQYGIEIIADKILPIEMVESIIMLESILSKLGINKTKLKINYLGTKGEQKNYAKVLQKEINADRLCESCQKNYNSNPLRMLDCKKCEIKAPKIINNLQENSRLRFEAIQGTFKDFNVDYEIDQKLVRGLDYYEGFVFEIFDTTRDSEQVAVCGGGEYSEVIEKIAEMKKQGFGFAVGIERIELMINDYTQSKKDFLLLTDSNDNENKLYEIKISLALAGINSEIAINSKNKWDKKKNVAINLLTLSENEFTLNGNKINYDIKKIIEEMREL